MDEEDHREHHHRGFSEHRQGKEDDREHQIDGAIAASAALTVAAIPPHRLVMLGKEDRCEEEERE